MEIWIVIGFAIPLILLVYYQTSKGKHSAKQQSQHPVETFKKFPGVGIKPCPNSCYSASILQRKRFLPSEAPMLPLNDCDRAVCECTYNHFTDRRSGEDRRFPSIEMDSEFLQKNQRVTPDRRRKKGRPNTISPLSNGVAVS